MPFVVDASVTACWLMPDEAHPLATKTHGRLANDHTVVPRIWWFEIRNLLVVNKRRGRLDAGKSNRARDPQAASNRVRFRSRDRRRSSSRHREALQAQRLCCLLYTSDA